MLSALAIAVGAVAGSLLSWIPGMHLALVLALALIVLPPCPETVCFVAAAAGAGVYARRLSAAYNPAAGSADVASMEPALRLTHQGRAKDALKIMVTASDMSWFLLVPALVLLAALAASAINGAKVLDQMLSWVGVPVICLWLVHVLFQAKKKLLTFIALLLASAIGYVCLHAPVATGSEHQLAPLMIGLFTAAIAVGVLKVNARLPPQQAEKPIAVNPALGFVGVAVGVITGFLAGLGTGSLVAMCQSLSTSDEDYLLMSSAAEAMNDFLALLLILVAGMGRSGEAVLLGRATGQVELSQALVVFGCVIVGAIVGRVMTVKGQDLYHGFVTGCDHRLWLIPVAALACFQLWLHPSPLFALAATISGCCLSLWNRAQYLSTQTVFAALAVPLVLLKLNLVPGLNSLLF